MEVNTVPMFEAVDGKGVRYTRIPRLQFPRDADGHTMLMQDFTLYGKGALHAPVGRWLQGAPPPSGSFDPAAALVPNCSVNVLKLDQSAGKPTLQLTGLDRFATPALFAPGTYGLDWKEKQEGMAHFPEYFREENGTMVAISAPEVPAETKLTSQTFAPARADRSYLPPEKEDFWAAQPAASAEFDAVLSDGSAVTYRWYKFVEQPALRGFALGAQEKEQLQKVATTIQEHWSLDREYMKPPTRGIVATLDASLLVSPPVGLELGYVPIVVRQSKTSAIPPSSGSKN